MLAGTKIHTRPGCVPATKYTRLRGIVRFSTNISYPEENLSFLRPYGHSI